MAVTVFFSLFFGIIEGLTEFIPVSSTAHILLGARYLELTPTPFFEVFTVAIQSGAMLAAVFYFWNTVWQHKSLITKVAVGFIPTAIAGLLLHSIVSKLFAAPGVISWALIIGGVILIILKPVDDYRPIETISYKEALLLGCTQIIAFIPGVSRSGATLIGGTLLGIPRAHIVTFSFLLGIPTILGATVVELHSMPYLGTPEWQWLGIGTVTAFFVALWSMKFFITLLKKKPLSWFGWYRIAIGALSLLFF